MRYPGSNGQPAASPAITLRYTIDGMVADRTDGRGVKLSHTYDALGRRVLTVVDDSAWYDANSSASANAPPNLITSVGYAYDAVGRPTNVTAYTGSGFSNIGADNAFDYDDFGNLLRERQQHGCLLNAYSPTVDYTWTLASDGVGGFNRLTGITYPVRNASGERRALALDYGNNADDLDHALNRITAISESNVGGLAAYQYMGLSRRVGLSLGWGVTQTVASEDGYTGLDRFGRIVDLHYRNGDNNTLHRYQHGHDLAGNPPPNRIPTLQSGIIGQTTETPSLA